MVLVGRLPAELLEYLLLQDATYDRINLRTLDACCLFELCKGPRLGRNQLWAGSERREVAADSARFV